MSTRADVYAEPLSALELLERWSIKCGPDRDTQGGSNRIGTLGLRRLPVYRRDHKARRRATPAARWEHRGTGDLHDAVGMATAWSPNGPPALFSA